MTRSHNIVGSEASERDRLVAFCHAHGAIQAFPRRPNLLPALTFAAGALLAAIAFLFALKGR